MKTDSKRGVADWRSVIAVTTAYATLDIASMIRPIQPDAWLEFKRRLPQSTELYSINLPADLPYQGAIDGSFDYILPPCVLDTLRRWLANRKEEEILYFLTEVVGNEKTDFAVSLSSLNEAELLDINHGRENVLAGTNGEWALFVDHEGALHVSGPIDLFEILKTAAE